MYLAPLNYDRYFKKVFDEPKIAKRFLEDFLDITIANKTRKLDFLKQNKLIYAFQKNIIKNEKYSRYLPWFQIAEKTLDRLNQKEWFNPYLKDNIFVEIIKRINKEVLKEDDYTYIQDHDEFWEQVKRFEEALKSEGIEEGIEKGIIQTAINGIKSGFSNEIIIKMTNLTDEIINNLRKQIENK